MTRPHVFRSGALEWAPHPVLPGLRWKPLQDRAAGGPATVSLVEVEAAGRIVPHLHEHSHETAYVLEGSAVLTLPSGDHSLEAGDGVTVPPGTLHSLRNDGARPCRILALHMPPLS